MTSQRRALVLLAAAFSLIAADAGAQTLTPPAQRQIQGLFGRARNANGLDVSFLTFQGYDDEQLGEDFGLLDPRRPKSGAFDGLDMTVTAKRKFRRVSLEGAEQSGVRYYPTIHDLVGVRHSASVGLGVQFDRIRIHVAQSLVYAPLYSYTTLPEVFEAQPTAVPVAMDQFLIRRPTFVTDSSGELSQALGRATLSVAGRTQRTDFHEDTRQRLRSDSASARLVYHLTRADPLPGAAAASRRMTGRSGPAL